MEVEPSSTEEFSEQYSENLDSGNTGEGNKESTSEEYNNIDNDEAKVEIVKLTQLPLARIKSIMKMDPDVNLASTDAVFAITKATEMFIDSIAKEAYSYTAKAKRKIITKKDLDTVIDTVDCLCFLDGATDF